VPLSRDEVLWAYRVLLDREVESEKTLAYWVETRHTLADLCQSIMVSEEFQSRLRVAFPIPEPVLAAVLADSPSTNQIPRLALATIVKDEAHRVGDMLRSVIEIIDHAVIVDTGSSDDTVGVCTALLAASGKPHQIAQIPFEGDFAHVRNASLDMVPADIDWILILDADETLGPGDGERLRGLLRVDVEAWDLPRYNWTNLEKLEIGPGSYPDFQRRLIRNNAVPPIRFKGQVHEYIDGVRRALRAPTNTLRVGGSLGGPHIHHYGLVQMTEAKLERKAEFYAGLGGKAASV
jgi:Glycosyl transferase family 2